jgi:hypothetical protein
VIVLAGGGQLTQGTGWPLRPDLIVTAFHVVGNVLARGWLHESRPDVSYHLLRDCDEGPLLDPLLYDPDTDVAILCCTPPLHPGEVLRSADAPASPDTNWDAETHPVFRGGQPFTLSGTVKAVREDRSSQALQLLVEQGTRVSWDGVSGSAVCSGGRAVGVITAMTDGANTGWAASVKAVHRLLRILDDPDLVRDCWNLLMELYADPNQLLALRNALGLPPEAADRDGPFADRLKIAERLVRRAAQEGAAGLFRLAELTGHDHPGSVRVGELKARIQRCDPGRERIPPRMSLVSEVVGELQTPAQLGVALLEPLGYGAWDVVDAVFREVKRSAPSYLPVRLVPYRWPASEDQLYRKLMSHLRKGIENQVGPRLEDRWERAFQQDLGDGFGERERFEDALELLVETAGREGRVLLLVVDSLARLPTDQLMQLGYLIARRCQRGPLKVLAWGGQELDELRTRPNADASAFHHLKGVVVEALDSQEVEDLVAAGLGDGVRKRAGIVYAVTDGHPALVGESIADHASDVRAGDADALVIRLLCGTHMTILRRTAEADPELQRLLIQFAAAGEGPFPRDYFRRGEERLRWLGILQGYKCNDNQDRWKWAAPVMRRFAEEWRRQGV